MSDYALPDVTAGNAGKRTAKPTSASDIGDPYIEHGTTDELNGGGFLTAAQRARLVSNYQGRVMNAADAFYGALAAIGLEEAMKKDEDVDIFTSLAIDALGIVSSTAAKLAAKAVRGGSVGVAFLGPLSSPEDAKKGDESALSHVIKAANDAGKKALKSAATSGTEFDRSKAVTSSYLAQLSSNAAITFQHHREDPPGMLGDADLIMLYHSWDAAMGHNTGMYQAELAKALARFRSSTASKIGRTDRRVHGESPQEIAERGGDMGEIVAKVGDSQIRDTKLVLQVYDDGESAPDLMYYVRDYDVPFNGGGMHDQTKDLSLFDNTGWKPSHRVEPDMVEAASAQNRAMWGRDHEVIHMSGRAPGPAAYTDAKTRPPSPPARREPAQPDREITRGMKQ